jgi:hypothetical protein
MFSLIISSLKTQSKSSNQFRNPDKLHYQTIGQRTICQARYTTDHRGHPSPPLPYSQITSLHQVVTPTEWLTARKELLAKEKAALRASDAFNAQLRDFPMVKLDKNYTFTGPNGPVTLADVFEGRKQLIVYHFMLGPEDKVGCTGCSFMADNLPPYAGHLNSKDTTLVL